MENSKKTENEERNGLFYEQAKNTMLNDGQLVRSINDLTNEFIFSICEAYICCEDNYRMSDNHIEVNPKVICDIVSKKISEIKKSGKLEIELESGIKYKIEWRGL
jgi:hypothetical protein